MIEEAKHNSELEPLDDTMVYADYRFDIRGGHGYYDEVEPERKWSFEPFEFSAAFKPFEAGTKPFEFIEKKR